MTLWRGTAQRQNIEPALMQLNSSTLAVGGEGEGEGEEKGEEDEE